MLHARFDFFRNLSTEKKLMRYATVHTPILHVVENRVGPQPTDRSYGCLLIDWVKEIMINDPEARKELVDMSEDCKAGKFREERAVLADWMHASAFAKHPASAPYIDSPGDPVRLLIFVLMGYDDLELINPLGVQRGVRKQACFYGAFGNLPPQMRFTHKYLCIMAMCDEKVLTKCDPVRVIAGADPVTGELMAHDWASPGAQFRAGEAGHIIKVCTSHPPTQFSPASSRPPRLARHELHLGGRRVRDACRADRPSRGRLSDMTVGPPCLTLVRARIVSCHASHVARIACRSCLVACRARLVACRARRMSLGSRRMSRERCTTTTSLAA